MSQITANKEENTGMTKIVNDRTASENTGTETETMSAEKESIDEKTEKTAMETNITGTEITDMETEMTGTEAVMIDTETEIIDKTKHKKWKKREKKEKQPMDKAKKKKMRRRIAAFVAVVLIAVFFIRNSIVAKNTNPVVYTMEASVEDVEQTLRTGGTVKSMESKSYFASVAAPVSEVMVSAGDKVKKGDVLLKYDEAALAQTRQEAELKLASNEGNYDSSIYKNDQYIADLSEANTNLDVLDQQISDNENYLKELQKKIEDKKAWYANQGALLQVSLLEWEKTIQDEKQALNERNAEEAQRDMNDKEKREKEEKDDAAKSQIDSDEEVYLGLQQEVQYNAYEQQNNQEIRDLQREAADVEALIADYKEYRAEMVSQKTTSENGVLDAGSKDKLEADTALQKLENGETLAAVDAVKDGVLADFAGVVTEVEIVEGATPAENSKLLVLESMEKVLVRVNVSKYDLEKLAVGQRAEVDIAGRTYEGEVAKIDGMATVNSNGSAVVSVDITIDNPDEGIFLGVEEKVTVHTALAEGVVAIPMELINSDREGDFVYVEDNGIVAKRRVTVGISSESVCEIKDGLAAGEKVILSNGEELEEGMPVTAVLQE